MCIFLRKWLILYLLLFGLTTGWLTATSEGASLSHSPAQEPTSEGASLSHSPAQEPTRQAVVPFGNSYTFTTQINRDGFARISADHETYETLSFTITMKQHMSPEDYAAKYASSYHLRGNEASAGFELLLNDYLGVTPIVPQNVIRIGFESASGETINWGYQLIDAEISGNIGVTVISNKPQMLYKRYMDSGIGEDMRYMSIICYNNGVARKILFDLMDESVT